MGTIKAAIMHERGGPEVLKIESRPIRVPFRKIGRVLLATIGYATFVQAQPVPQAPAGNAVPVTADNFNRAETDMYFGKRVKKGGRTGNLSHSRELYLTDSPVVRPNRDTLYSAAVFDYDAGPVLVTVKGKPLRDGLRPPLTVTARGGQSKPGRDEEMIATWVEPGDGKDRRHCARRPIKARSGRGDDRHLGSNEEMERIDDQA
jgi:Protein of unknown function (DUF1254)